MDKLSHILDNWVLLIAVPTVCLVLAGLLIPLVGRMISVLFLTALISIEFLGNLGVKTRIRQLKEDLDFLHRYKEDSNIFFHSVISQLTWQLILVWSFIFLYGLIIIFSESSSADYIQTLKRIIPAALGAGATPSFLTMFYFSNLNQNLQNPDKYIEQLNKKITKLQELLDSNSSTNL